MIGVRLFIILVVRFLVREIRVAVAHVPRVHLRDEAGLAGIFTAVKLVKRFTCVALDAILHV